MDEVIQNIKLRDIHAHPDNPRKNLGDLEELADSIKKNGIMQNLTVIPGRYNQTGAFVDEDYTLIIGHRRCEAARLAGLTEVPCKVVKSLPRREQVSIMLEENMHRNDLTIVEQAQGFQMMLDLGETEDSIAEKTGFSKSTIKRRLNIAKLDTKILKNKQEDECFQLSLNDLYALEKIEDVKERNRILKESTSSNNMLNKIDQSIRERRAKKNEEYYTLLFISNGIKAAPKGAENESWSNKWDVLKTFDLYTGENERKSKLGLPAKEDKSKVYYVKYYREMALIKKKEKPKKEAPTKEELARKEREKKIKEVREKNKIMSKERSEFLFMAIKKKLIKDNPKIAHEALKQVMICSSTFSRQQIIKAIGIDYWSFGSEERDQILKDIDTYSLTELCIAEYVAAMSEKDTIDYYGKYIKESAEKLRGLTDMLEYFGFSYSDSDSYAILDGTSELYEKEESK